MSDTSLKSPTDKFPLSVKEDALYRENVAKLMASGSDALISNGMPQHAAALFECFFRNAVSEVKIICRTLQRAVFDHPDVLSSFLSAARRSVSVQVLVQEEPEADSLFLQTFRSQQAQDGSKISIETAAAGRSSLMASHRPNFAVMDRKALRYEPNPDECKAVASMNQPAMAGKLCVVFDRMYFSLRQEAALATI